MKQIIAMLLMPLAIIISFFQIILESSVFLSIGEGISKLVEENYKFWEKIFRWK